MARPSKFFPAPIGVGENADNLMNFQRLSVLSLFFSAGDNKWLVTSQFDPQTSQASFNTEAEARAYFVKLLDQADSAGP